MSKEIDALNAYIENQQSKIANLMKTIMMMETKIKLLEDENEKLKNINNDYREQLTANLPKRNALSLSIKSVDGDRLDEIPSPKEVKKITQQGFSLKEMREKIQRG